MENAEELERCKLCRDPAELRDSHLLSKLIFRWQRSPGGLLRNSANIDLPVQDGPKARMLGDCCERRFNSYETPFANEFFHVVVEDRMKTIPYKEWMLKFCASISWRLLRDARDTRDLSEFDVEQISAIDRALERWADFLMDRAANPGGFEQHLFRFHPVGAATPTMPTVMNRYLLSEIEGDMGYTDDIMFTCAKVGPLAVLGLVRPPKKAWAATRVRVRGGVSNPRTPLPPIVASHLWNRARALEQAINAGVSERQVEKMEERARKLGANFIESRHAEAMLLDHQLFGPRAATLRTKVEP